MRQRPDIQRNNFCGVIVLKPDISLVIPNHLPHKQINEYN